MRMPFDVSYFVQLARSYPFILDACRLPIEKWRRFLTAFHMLSLRERQNPKRMFVNQIQIWRFIEFRRHKAPLVARFGVTLRSERTRERGAVSTGTLTNFRRITVCSFN
jgi:hypothetical protein